MLLENQLPYFILEKLAELIDFPPHGFRESIIKYFGLEDERFDFEFSHFTDLFRRVSVETLPYQLVKKIWLPISIGHMYNTCKLNSAGVEFSLNKKTVGKRLSLDVKLENDCLKMPHLRVDDEFEMTLRNVMAFEQCHYPFCARVCDYVIFLDYLIDTDKDVNMLVEKGIIENHIGEYGSVAEMVNKLGVGIFDTGSYYSMIAADVVEYYTRPVNKSRAILKNVYFNNLWTGTATVAAIFLLVMTFTQTIASIIQVMQNSP